MKPMQQLGQIGDCSVWDWLEQILYENLGENPCSSVPAGNRRG